jgi:hypothetical protein
MDKLFLASKKVTLNLGLLRTVQLPSLRRARLLQLEPLSMATQTQIRVLAKRQNRAESSKEAQAPAEAKRTPHHKTSRARNWPSEKIRECLASLTRWHSNLEVYISGIGSWDLVSRPRVRSRQKCLGFGCTEYWDVIRLTSL